MRVSRLLLLFFTGKDRCVSGPVFHGELVGLSCNVNICVSQKVQLCSSDMHGDYPAQILCPTSAIFSKVRQLIHGVCVLSYFSCLTGEATALPHRVALQPGADQPVYFLAVARLAGRPLPRVLHTEKQRPHR